MRRGFVSGIVLVIAAFGGLGCNVVIGVDEPIFRPSAGAGGSGGMGGAGGAGGAACLPVEQACDGIDEDCNGTTDDVPVIQCGMGVCQASVPGCTDGKPSECIPGLPNQLELCDNDNDGLDDDCDGLVDEGCPCKKGETQPCYTGAADTRNVGECKDGTQTCIADNEWGPCTGDILPALEACNGLDDDCDAQADEGFPVITCGIGACENTVPNCNPSDPPVCTPKDPQEEVCNGADDDCDSQIDENNPGGGGPCLTGEAGPCANGIALCQGGALACLPIAMPTMETCNGVDDDCNGTADDNVVADADCMTGKLGVCATGKTSCLVGSLVCMEPSPGVETCNGLDDDCDGEVDDHGVDAGLDCDTMIPGICAAGTTVCMNAVLTCNQKNIAENEVCDNKDNDCDGQVDDGDPGGGGACVYPGQKGVCAQGIYHCQGGLQTCTQTNMASAETCNGLDDDCDGDVDEAIICGTCGGMVTQTSSCTSMALPSPVTLTEGCKQVFPPALGLPATISNPGTQYYVTPAGNDAADGLSPATAWKTLCHAIAASKPGSTVQVAQGAYLSTSLVLAKGLTVKGGYSSNFAIWNPDTYQSIFYGRLTMDHNTAVWGGFRMIGNPIGASQVQHAIRAGTFVRNYVEVKFGAGAVSSGGIDAKACSNGVVSLWANDIYAGSTASTTHTGIQLGYQQGSTKIDGNRICVEGKANATNYGLFGYGPNVASAASLTVTNNLIEMATAETALVRLEGANGGVDYPIVFTNNTLLALSTGFSGTAATSGKMRWRLTNNVIFSMSGGSIAVNLGANGAGLSFDSAENNLVFGFNNNLFAQPAPVTLAGNDTSNGATATSVFMNAAGGDFTIKATPGQADATGKNVYNNATYGSVTLDLALAPRPGAGAWDRGAYKN